MKAVFRFCVAAGMGLFLAASTHGASIVFQADFQAATVESNTSAGNLTAGTAIGAWHFVTPTNNHLFADATGTQKALCTDGAVNLAAVFANPLTLKSNPVVTLLIARGRSGTTGTGKWLKLIGQDDLGNTSFDLKIFANQDQAAGTNGALYWNNGDSYTNWFGTNYSAAGDVRFFVVSPTGYNPGGLSALRIELFETGYLVHLNKLNSGADTWVSDLLPYNGTATNLSRISLQGGPGGGFWIDNLLAQGALANPPGSFTPAANMNTARSRFTMTLLRNGTVLAAGGSFANSTITNSAEIFDPATRTWTLTGPLNQARYEHSATLLTNGLVLVAGGTDNTGQGPQASAELYDPVTGTWSFTDPMKNARTMHSATLLMDGRVLVAGGYNGSGAMLSVEIYDPKTGTWSTADSMVTRRWNHASTLLPDGRAMVAGGWNGNALPGVEVYDATSNLWTRIGAMAADRDWPVAVVLPDGKAMVAGGSSDPNGGSGAGGSLASAELVEPASGALTLAQNMNSSRYEHTLTLLADGAVLAAGGTKDAISAIATAEIYNPAKGTWSLTGKLNSPRRFHSATLLKNGMVLVAGGADSGSLLASAELYAATQPAGIRQQNPQRLPHLPNGALCLSFASAPHTTFSVLGARNLSVPLTNWTILGPATEIWPGVYQFSDSPTNATRFYRVRSP